MIKITGNEPANILTIRQEFSAIAMQGLLASKIHLDEGLHIKCDVAGVSMESLISAMAVRFSDSLIEEYIKKNYNGE